ncbi:MAG: hypothetical protein E3J35_09240 [Methanomassiliicoccales archaeon]|nr:MAG: hypothetical protein E3J35_09240 [Methanomassiliicoccales archaeon]
MEKHAIDPGWEVGTYSVCHPDIRRYTDAGARIFDVVAKDGRGVIRSAFVVTKVRNTSDSRVLYFDEFYFADEYPIVLPGPPIQYRKMKMASWIRKYNRSSPWVDIIDNYIKYRKGQKPKSIDSKSWDYMVSMSTRIRRLVKSRKSGIAESAKRKP